MENIRIEKVTTNDAGFLFQLMNEPSVISVLHEVPTQISDWQEAVLAWLEDADEKGYIVFIGSTPVGWFAVNGLLAEDHSAFLKIAVLLPSWQSKHIGRYVLSQIIKIQQSAGIRTLTLFTDQSNVKAQKCYEACGFEIVETLTEEMSDQTIVKRYKMECNL